MDDTKGVLSGLESGNYQDALDYYYHRKTIDGQKFDGFYSNGDKKLKFLSEIGVDQTSKDWHAIINRELPDGDYRATKVSEIRSATLCSLLSMMILRSLFSLIFAYFLSPGSLVFSTTLPDILWEGH